MFFRRCKGFPLEEQMGRQAGMMNAWKTSVSTELYHHIEYIYHQHAFINIEIHTYGLYADCKIRCERTS